MRSHELTLPGGAAVVVPVRARRGQRRLRLTVDIPGALRCSVPPRTPAAEVDRFLRANAAWAKAALEHWRARSNALPLAPEARSLDERQLRRRARHLAEARAAERGRELGVTPSRIRIGDPRSRWGSASSQGTLSFSFRLALAPDWILDYVVCHEVAHLREPNHSAAFWALVDAICPRRREAQRWLREHGAALHAWIPAASARTS